MQNILLELQTGQVAFISGLMAGFALTVAAHILRHGLNQHIEQIVFLLLVITTLLFLTSLYLDVRLNLELVGIETLSAEAQQLVSSIRVVGTNSATAGFAIFIISIGLLGWIERPLLGIITSGCAIAILATLGALWFRFLDLQALLGT